MAIVTSSGNYANRTSGLINYNGAYTVMAWFRPTALSGIQWFYGNGQGSDDFNGAASTGDYMGPWDDRFVIGCNGSEWGDYTNPLMTAGNWYHGCLKRTSATSLIGLRDGVAFGTVSTDVSGRSANGFDVLGRFNALAFGGRIAALKAWSAALSDSEIEAEMAVGPPIRTADLVTYTPFLATTEPEIFQSTTGTHWTEVGSVTSADGPPIDWGGGGGGNALLLQLMQHGHLNGGLL